MHCLSFFHIYHDSLFFEAPLADLHYKIQMHIPCRIQGGAVAKSYLKRGEADKVLRRKGYEAVRQKHPLPEMPSDADMHFPMSFLGYTNLVREDQIPS